MSLLEQFGSPALMRALGWTLLHSLWQGALVALAAAALLMLLHRHAAALRYKVAAAALLTLLLLSGITLGYYYSTFRAAPATEAPYSAGSPTDELPGVDATGLGTDVAAVASETGATAAPAPGRLRQLLTTGQLYLERNMPVVVVAWLLGMLAMTLRFLSGLAYVQRLRRYRVAALPAEWQTRLDALVARTALRQPVRILASGLVPGPLVIGWLKPVILLPMSAASGMSGAELEAILAHELAHVLRRDYLFNLLQSVAEILFFYHPAVWFLSNCLRTERENCCDDMATELCGDSLVLAQALASLATLQHAPTRPALTPRLAMAAAGQPGSLLGRVRRLVQHRATAPTFSDGFWAACVVLLSVGVLTTSTVLSLSAASFSTAVVNKGAEALREQFAKGQIKEEAENQVQTETQAEAQALEQTSPDENPEGEALTVNYRGNELKPGSDDTVVVYSQANPKLSTKSGRARLNEIKGLTVVVKNEQGAISEVYVDGKKVPAGELPAYQQALAKSQQTNRGNTLADRRQATRERMAQLSQRMSSAALAGRAPTDADAEELSRLAMAEAGEAMRDQPWANQDEMDERFAGAERALNEQLQNGHLNAEQRAEIRNELQKVQQEKRRMLEQYGQDREQALRDAAQARQDAAQARRDAMQARRDAMQAQLDQDQARRDEDQARRDEEQARRDAKDEIWRQALISELKRDGLIRNPDTYSFSLSATSLTVNGKKQPDAVQQKYRKFYEDRTGRKLSATGSINIQQQSNASARRYSLPAPPSPPSAPAAPAAPSVPAPPAPPRISSDQIREKLRQDGLIEKDAKSFMFQLNDKGLVVNGEPQSAAMADKYRKLLGSSAKSGKGQSTNTSINISVSE
ncbi:M56 family metallopeptidase [Hymenobacter yonginensis]|uniref:M48 family metalloprotease n=1 Tax=Hymenobacter yonginensis TaxID=748197 RepID=A0ABY7PKQ4_9BACT|nr:M56 family metallopeptidase [Hymenobacter yonginensis]WBO83197.1 M48 family metalloprotease [Hymenobacter yonginensis]